MELREFLLIIKKNLNYFIIFAIIGAVIGFSSKSFFQSGYLLTQTYFLTDSINQSQLSEGPQSESFFLQEKTSNFTDTAIAILDSSDFKSEIVPSPNSLTVRKVAPQIIRLTYISKNPNDAKKNLNEIIGHFNQKIQSLTESTQTSQLKAIGNESRPTFSSLNSSVLSIAGVLIGILFGLLVIGSKNYFKI